MANSLLDFVMSVVRDPDAAAHYAANPAQAIADANLVDVSSVDVDNLIPVVSESLSTAAPSTGFDSFLADAGSNVWASGAATEAFDAFDDQLPIQGGDVFADQVPTVATIVDQPAELLDAAPTIVDGLDGVDVPSIAAVSEPLVMDLPALEDVHELDATPLQDAFDGGPGADDHPHPRDPGFDIFT